MFERSKKAPGLAGRLIAVAAVVPLSVFALLLALHPAEEDAAALYVVANDAYVPVDELNADVFLTDGSAELVSRSDGSDLLLSEGLEVSVSYAEETFSVMSREETVTDLLERLEIRPSPLEMVAVAFSDQAAEITIGSEFVFYEHISTVTEHEIVYQYNDTKPDWYESVIQDGSDGLYSEVYEVIYQDGEETSRHLIDVVDTEPVPTVVERGTLANFANNDDPVSEITTNSDGTGTITLENGQVLTFREARTMKGTAYTAGEPKVDTVTATGTTVRLGVVAVDRRVLPLGSKVYVVSNDGMYTYGFAIAEDTGVRGNIIDLYMNTYDECIQFGVRDCTVYILD